MKKRAFTLLEMLIVVIIISVTVTIGYPSYQNSLEESKAELERLNFMALGMALDSYAMEHDTMPADLSALPQDSIDKAYAKVLKENDTWRIRLARFIVEQEEKGLAYAFLADTLARGNLKIITCPKDTTPPSAGGRSYGINSAIANISADAYRALPDTTLVIADCENATFSTSTELAERHKKFALFTSTPYALSFGKDIKIYSAHSGTVEERHFKR
jgi:prepilin-type N-terminal cleavage/methylation domain-containing protein